MENEVVAPVQLGETTKMANRLESYPYRKLIPYEPPVDRPKFKGCKELGVGIFWDGKNEKVALIPYRLTQKGEIRWGTRKGMPKRGRKGFYCHYDMVLISPAILFDVADAMRSVVSEWFGGPEKAGERMVEHELEVKEWRISAGKDKDTELTDIIRKNQLW